MLSELIDIESRSFLSPFFLLWCYFLFRGRAISSWDVLFLTVLRHGYRAVWLQSRQWGREAVSAVFRLKVAFCVMRTRTGALLARVAEGGAADWEVGAAQGLRSTQIRLQLGGAGAGQSGAGDLWPIDPRSLILINTWIPAIIRMCPTSNC